MKHLNLNKITIIIILLILITIINIPITNAAVDVTNETEIYSNVSDDEEIIYKIIDTIGIKNFENIKYIENANYFKVNPYHAANDGSDNEAGTCTTVAMQMLMGYHNYYSDGRLIPKLGGNNLRYLNDDYRNVVDNPKINTTVGTGYGKFSIGTEVGFYEELMDLNSFSGAYGLGQAINLVADGALEFIKSYSKLSKDTVKIKPGFFNSNKAKEDINNGKPIILGCNPIGTQASNFHVVVAYGYATYNGEEGFIVHNGGESETAHVWYPASCIGFQIRMSVDHEHNFKDTGEIIDNKYRIVKCACYCTDLKDLYELSSDGSTIIGVNFSLPNRVNIPSYINDIAITAIGNNAFKNCTNIVNINFPMNLTTIGSNAFENCSSLVSLQLPSNLKYIGDNAFKGCTKILAVHLPNNIIHIGTSSFEGCTSLKTVIMQKKLTSIGDSAFKDCVNLTSVIIPNTINSINDNTFEGCTRLTNVTIPNTVTNIGKSAFKNCTNLTSITIPNTVTNIGNNAFEGCTNLENVTLPDNLTRIGVSAFKNCSSFTNIIIPSLIEYIGKEAFYGCTNLSRIEVLKSKNNIPDLGLYGFDECADDLEIIVPTNKIVDYVNGYSWDSYKHIIKPSENIDELLIDCEHNISQNLTLNAGYNKLYKLNVNCAKAYKILATSSEDVLINLYDRNMNFIDINYNIYNYYFSRNTYYISISFSGDTSGGQIEMNITLRWGANRVELQEGTTNIKSYLHNTIYDKNHACFVFINDSFGFYKIKLDAGVNASYQDGSIKIYNDYRKKEMVNRIGLSDKNNLSSSFTNENEMYVYFANTSYYVDIELSSNDYDPVLITIEKVESDNINYASSLTNTTTNELFSNKTLYSYFKEVTISHRSKFELQINISGNFTDLISLYILEKHHDPGCDEEYYCVVKNTMTYINNSDKNRVLYKCLDAGTYYIGYLNNRNNVTIKLELKRLVDQEQNISGTLVTDPAYKQGFQLGSEVIFNNGSLKGSTITEGFTRNLYLMVKDRENDPMSRLEYDWYSSDDNIAKVSGYGTVLAMPVNNDSSVTIYAVNKEDPSIVYKKDLTILKETKTDEIIIESYMTYSYSSENGLYTLELNFSNSPYPYISYYVWDIEPIDDITVDMEHHNMVSSSGPGEALIMGNYKLNRRIFLKIHLTITE